MTAGQSQRSIIVVHPDFDRTWPWAADHFRVLWEAQGQTEYLRLGPDDRRAVCEIVVDPAGVTRLVALNVPVTVECVARMPALREAVFSPGPSTEVGDALAAGGVRNYVQPSEGFWGQSVAEFALALTLCGLRRIPQLHRAIVTSPQAWDYAPPGGIGQPGTRGQQFGDDPNFANGTVEGKRIRVVGAGNVASRYASFVHALGADVAAWDPFASEPCFHRAGARREVRIDSLFHDADIFAPMVPLTDETRGLVKREIFSPCPAAPWSSSSPGRPSATCRRSASACWPTSWPSPPTCGTWSHCLSTIRCSAVRTSSTRRTSRAGRATRTWPLSSTRQAYDR